MKLAVGLIEREKSWTM